MATNPILAPPKDKIKVLQIPILAHLGAHLQTASTEEERVLTLKAIHKILDLSKLEESEA